MLIRKKLLFPALFLSLPVAMFAKGAISGTVIEKDTKEPIVSATIQLYDGQTDKPLAIGDFTTDDGTFILKDVPDGKYIVRISNLGNIMQERPVTVSGNDVEIGVVRLADDSKMLEEVVVEGVKGQMHFELDKRVFNVDSNIAAAGASASELLESIPSVTVDQDGEISLRGDSSVTVWINGKESGLTADNRAQILEQIPAETIEKIEVITNPSAKYSPEGTSGIINIVLKEGHRAGYFGSAELGANSRGGGNAGVNINYNTGKFETFSGLGFRMNHNYGGSFSRRDYTDTNEYLYSDGNSRNHGNNLFLRLGATYHMTSADDLYFSGFGMYGHRHSANTTNYTSNLPSHWIEDSNVASSSSNMYGAHAELGYSHKFSPTHHIDVNVGYNYWGGPNNNTYTQSETYADGSINDIYQSQDSEFNVQSISAKVDYTNQLTSWLKLEAGYNGDYSHEISPVNTLQGSTPENAVPNNALYNKFVYSNNISALYATLGGKYKNFSFSAGLRSEAWQVNADSWQYENNQLVNNPFSTSKFGLFPSAFVSWALPYDNELQVNYTRRIRRPWGGQLNSFCNIADPTNISYGNPALQPMYTDAFELNYIKSWTFHMISVSAYYRHNSNLMGRISYLDGAVMYSTFANVSNSANLGVEIVAKNNLFKILDLTTTVNLYNSHVAAWSIDFEHDGKLFPVSGDAKDEFAWDFRCMASLKLPWGLSFQATGSYNSGRLTPQGKMQQNWSVDAGLRKNVGNWSFSLNCRNIFDSRKFHSITYGPNYTQEDSRWHGGRTFRLTIKYAFGNMKAKRNPMMDGMDGGGVEMDGGYSTESIEMQ